MRLPPANRQRTARWIVSGHADSGGNARWSASSTAASLLQLVSVERRPLIASGASRAKGVLGRSRSGQVAARVLHEELDLSLRLLELGVAERERRIPYRRG
jgi:hypothetical protein